MHQLSYVKTVEAYRARVFLVLRTSFFEIGKKGSPISEHMDDTPRTYQVAFLADASFLLCSLACEIFK